MKHRTIESRQGRVARWSRLIVGAAGTAAALLMFPAAPAHADWWSDTAADAQAGVSNLGTNVGNVINDPGQAVQDLVTGGQNAIDASTSGLADSYSGLAGGLGDLGSQFSSGPSNLGPTLGNVAAGVETGGTQFINDVAQAAPNVSTPPVDLNLGANANVTVNPDLSVGANVSFGPDVNVNFQGSPSGATGNAQLGQDLNVNASVSPTQGYNAQGTWNIGNGETITANYTPWGQGVVYDNGNGTTLGGGVDSRGGYANWTDQNNSLGGSYNPVTEQWGVNARHTDDNGNTIGVSRDPWTGEWSGDARYTDSNGNTIGGAYDPQAGQFGVDAQWNGQNIGFNGPGGGDWG
jgi:hypothetical protein